MFVTTPACPDLLLAASSAWTCYSAISSTPIAVLQWETLYHASLGPSARLGASAWWALSPLSTAKVMEVGSTSAGLCAPEQAVVVCQHYLTALSCTSHKVGFVFQTCPAPILTIIAAEK